MLKIVKSNPYIRLYLPLLSLFLLLTLVSCADKEDELPSGAVSKTSATLPAETGGSVSLTLVPDEPTVQHDIKAVVSGSVGSDELNYSWRVDGSSVDGVGTESLASAYFKKGQQVSVTVIVGTEVLSASTEVNNSVPEIRRVSLAPVDIYAGVNVSVQVEARDADGDSIGYNSSWFVNGAEVVTVHSNWLEGHQFQRGDEISVEVVPYDEEGEGVVYAPLPVTVPNGPPRFTSLPSLSFKAKLYRYQAQAVDPDGDELTYRLETGPDGMTVSEDGLVLWTIGIMGVGTHEIELVATDPEGAEAYQKYELTIDIR